MKGDRTELCSTGALKCCSAGVDRGSRNTKAAVIDGSDRMLGAALAARQG